ncbi:hypothetical protein GOP47_0007730 [Adiantum capillus-veneris]|uniref:Uncharacterized protein n=1 Tax=Adiantum capillus-veneris TaxID=13818 RepID=A0A9D4ZLT5_ADICA|nr:hypothetical protein GOP47_0007730 [Adiantum capillus-veneris]
MQHFCHPNTHLPAQISHPPVCISFVQHLEADAAAFQPLHSGYEYDRDAAELLLLMTLCLTAI